MPRLPVPGKVLLVGNPGIPGQNSEGAVVIQTQRVIGQGIMEARSNENAVPYLSP